MTEENLITTSFDNFIDNLSGHETSDKLFLTAGIVELLRHSKSTNTGFALAELLASLPAVEWDKISFSVTKTLLSSKYENMVQKLGVPTELVPTVLLTALCHFLSDFTTKQPTEDLLQQKIRAVVTELLEDSEPPAPERQTPELFNHWLLKRVFAPEPVTDDVLAKLDAKLVYFAGPLNGGVKGPEIRGLAFDNGTNQYFVLLESGEFVRVPKDYEHLRIVNKDVLFPDMPTALFLALCVVACQLEIYAVISKAQFDYIVAGNLGKPLKPMAQAVANAEDIAALEHVFDIGGESARIGAAGVTGPTGATVRFPIPDTDLLVVLDANQDAHGPYSTARLVRVNETGTETVLMRHETPRLYSLRGVYLFPLKDQLISLTIIN